MEWIIRLAAIYWMLTALGFFALGVYIIVLADELGPGATVSDKFKLLGLLLLLGPLIPPVIIYDRVWSRPLRKVKE